MNILHAHTDPTMLDRLKSMLAHSQQADIAVGYLFVSGFTALAAELEALEKVRVLVGRTDRATLDEVASSLQQAEALAERVESDALVRRSARAAVGEQAVDYRAGCRPAASGPAGAGRRGPAARPDHCGQAGDQDLPAGHAARQGVSVLVSRPRRAGRGHRGVVQLYPGRLQGNTELNVRVTGDAEMAELKRWFEALWADAVDVTDGGAVELGRSWALAATPPYQVYLKALYELYGDELGAPELVAKKTWRARAGQLPA